MRTLNLKEPFVLSIFANTRGFGYALFEGMAAPVDWGVKTVRKAGEGDKNRHCLENVGQLIKLFDPSVIVLQDCRGTSSHCSQRIDRLIADIKNLAKKEKIKVRQYSRSDIRASFSYYGASNKDEIARAIAMILPEFAPRVPPKRRIWMSEDYRMGMFDAIALVFAYYSNE